MEIESRKKLKIKNSLYKIALFSFLVVVVWIGFEIYWSYTRNQASEDIGKVNLTPITPDLHLELANQLSLRQTITDEEIQRLKATIGSITVIEPTPSASPQIDQTSLDDLSDDDFIEFLDEVEASESGDQAF